MSTKTIETNTPVKFIDQIEYSANGHTTVEIGKTHHGEALLLAADKDVVIPEHAVNAMAIVTVLEGDVDFYVGEAVHRMAPGDSIVLTPHTKHSLKAVTAFKIYLAKINA